MASRTQYLQEAVYRRSSNSGRRIAVLSLSLIPRLRRHKSQSSLALVASGVGFSSICQKAKSKKLAGMSAGVLMYRSQRLAAVASSNPRKAYVSRLRRSAGISISSASSRTKDAVKLSGEISRSVDDDADVRSEGNEDGGEMVDVEILRLLLMITVISPSSSKKRATSSERIGDEPVEDSMVALDLRRSGMQYGGYVAC